MVFVGGPQNHRNNGAIMITKEKQSMRRSVPKWKKEKVKTMEWRWSRGTSVAVPAGFSCKIMGLMCLEVECLGPSHWSGVSLIENQGPVVQLQSKFLYINNCFINQDDFQSRENNTWKLPRPPSAQNDEECTFQQEKRVKGRSWCGRFPP
jgi:hypothetical protein